ncbi:MAG: DsbE family thiol:disulfide interchange protein [Chromatiaceae bacterium]|nr:DsbE family thiol:disulfide interchange protein [Gammaproteobacteria bacterium]MCB1873329.1 DsbE family thiol:disulfide interchange protein [Gammaproteobacteria bacterium]MCB1881127.1 DsbE family thiol:disulfide interchange protein [Gammaproteobacteria bacterium]MCP5427465.1 DsbE family thiol:disulfide interchange protein [Chromatiaceae bacterium]MCP5447698.1 DsbE family thiol:disulfide interchange protein [Chromatiaceae bacterium]
MKARFLVPLGVFLVLVVLLGVGLTLDPRDVPSVLIDKKASEFSLRDLFDPDKTVDSASMKGKVWLVNVWGTWCPECWREHEFLLYLAKQERVPIVGIDWRDDDAEAKKFLQEKGNPFIAVGVDPQSDAVMDLGVYGAPETFLIDKQGVIRKKHKGAMTLQVWRDEFKPLIEKLEKS